MADEADDLIERMMMRMRAPKGSPAAIVEQRFPSVDEMNTLDLTEETAHQFEPNLYDDLARVSRPAGIDAFLESGPMSENVEDRRGETVDDLIRRVFQSEGRN